MSTTSNYCANWRVCVCVRDDHDYETRTYSGWYSPWIRWSCRASSTNDVPTRAHVSLSVHAVHHEADVRFHKHGATSAVPTRFYAGFPLTVPIVGGKPEDDEMTVGMLCCIDSKPRAEITRTQYATMKRLASTSSHFLLQKSRRLHQHIIATKAP
ncbi:hypothetical protein GQ600_11396 [Phytophthora cactorum]|nr:hypothetical protein GQ600_11396 [Phytophthora cactorum]